MEKSSQIAWKVVPLRHFFPLKVVPLIEVLLYFSSGSSQLGLPEGQAVFLPPSSFGDKIKKLSSVLPLFCTADQTSAEQERCGEAAGVSVAIGGGTGPAWGAGEGGRHPEATVGPAYGFCGSEH
jgi:hypothetical protein